MMKSRNMLLSHRMWRWSQILTLQSTSLTLCNRHWTNRKCRWQSGPRLTSWVRRNLFHLQTSKIIDSESAITCISNSRRRQRIFRTHGRPKGLWARWHSLQPKMTWSTKVSRVRWTRFSRVCKDWPKWFSNNRGCRNRNQTLIRKHKRRSQRTWICGTLWFRVWEKRQTLTLNSWLTSHSTAKR